MSNRPLAGRVAIVTGAAQGIGAAYALALAETGARISLCDLAAPEATALAVRDAGGEALAQPCDVTDRAAVARMANATVAAFGDVQVLVNNAAIFASLALKPAEEIPTAE